MMAVSNSALSAVQVENYWHNGFVILRDFLNHTLVEACRAELALLANIPEVFEDQPYPPPRHDLEGKPVLDRVEPFTNLSRHFAQLSQSELIMAPIRDVLNSDVHRFKEKLIIKSPGTNGYLPHQDFSYWEGMNIPADDMLSLYIALDDANEANGALELFPATHRTRLPSEENEPRDADPASLMGATSIIACCQAGDAVLFHSLTAHQSADNRSAGYRRSWFSSWTKAKWGDRYQQIYNGKRPLEAEQQTRVRNSH